MKKWIFYPIMLGEQDDKLVLCHLAQNLSLLPLHQDDFEKIYRQIVQQNQQENPLEDFMLSLLRLLHVHQDKGAVVYLTELNQQGICFG